MKWLFAVGILWLGVAQAAPPSVWEGLPQDPDAAWALWEQDRVPTLDARRAQAQARTRAAAGYADGSIPLIEAFPHLADARLDDPVVLAARLLALDDVTVAAESDRISQPPELGSPERQTQALDALARVLQAESDAASAERRLLLSLRARLVRWPAETQENTARLASAIDTPLAAARARLAADADDVEAARQVASLDAERARFDVLRRDLRRLATVPGAPQPSPDADIAVLQGDDFDAARRADARLALLRGHATGEAATTIDAARSTFRQDVWVPRLQRQKAALASPEAPPLHDDDLPRIIARLAALDVVAPEGFVDATLSMQGLAADEQIQALRIEIATLERAQLVAAQTRLTRTQSQAQEARQSSQEALDDAKEASSQRLAELLTSVSVANERAARALDRVSNVQVWGEHQQSRRTERLESLTSVMAEAHDNASVLLYSGGAAQPDTAYEAARSEVETLRYEALGLMYLSRAITAERETMLHSIQADRERLSELSRELTGAEDRTTREEALARWRSALIEEIDVAEQAERTVAAQQDAVLVALRAVKEGKRSLKGLISPDQRRVDWEQLRGDLIWERTLVWPTFLAMFNDQASAVVYAPMRLFNPVYASSFIRSGFWLFLFLAGWWWVRTRSPRIGTWLIMRAADRHSGRRSLFALHPEVTRTVRAVLDLAIGWLLRDSLVSFLPILGFAVWVYLQIAMYRLAVALFDLFVEPYGQVRPSLLTLGAKAYTLARHSLRWLAFWIISRGFVRQVLQGVLDADGLDIVARWGIDAVGLLGTLYLLHRWAPVLRAEIQSFHQESRWVRFLSKAPRFSALGAPWALITGAYLTAAWGWDRTQELARQREGFGRLLAAVTRYRLPSADDTTPSTEPVPDEVTQALSDRSTHYSHWVERTEADKLKKAFTAWDAEHRSGLIFVTGEPGEGKDHYLDRVIPQIVGEVPIIHAKVDRRLANENEAIAWLASVLGIEATETDSFVEQVEALPKHVLLIEDIQGAFLRTVGGFQGLRALLYVLNTASSQHFVVCSCHRMAFQYFRRLGTLVNVEVVREVIDLLPYGEKDMQTLVTQKLEDIGYTLRFDDMVHRSPFGVDPSIELRRAVGRFFLLLSDASYGNPCVALRLMNQCVTVSAQPSVLDVHIAACLGSGIIETLSDDEMFLLVALRVQGGLDEPELVKVTNMSANIVRNVVRNLLNRKLLIRANGTLSGTLSGTSSGTLSGATHDRVVVAMEQLPLVTRTLRRRHFLHFVS